MNYFFICKKKRIFAATIFEKYPSQKEIFHPKIAN